MPHNVSPGATATVSVATGDCRCWEPNQLPAPTATARALARTMTPRTSRPRAVSRVAGEFETLELGRPGLTAAPAPEPSPSGLDTTSTRWPRRGPVLTDGASAGADISDSSTRFEQLYVERSYEHRSASGRHCRHAVEHMFDPRGDGF